ncbi:MAG: hypothetical protein ACOCRK_12040, partial [bacterium]
SHEVFSKSIVKLDKKIYLSVESVNTKFNTKILNSCNLSFFIKPVYNPESDSPIINKKKVKYEWILTKHRIIYDEKHLPSIVKLLRNKEQKIINFEKINNKKICLLTVEYNEMNVWIAMNLIKNFVINKDYE